jgi:hypothetical protein
MELLRDEIQKPLVQNHLITQDNNKLIFANLDSIIQLNQ